MFGVRVLVLAAISVASCVLFEFLYRRMVGESDSVRDLSACVTGLLLAMSLPATASYWVPVLGGAFAIVVVKQFYGGLGKNFMNPALGGRMLLATFPMLMTKWPTPLHWLDWAGWTRWPPPLLCPISTAGRSHPSTWVSCCWASRGAVWERYPPLCCCWAGAIWCCAG